MVYWEVGKYEGALRRALGGGRWKVRWGNTKVGEIYSWVRMREEERGGKVEGRGNGWVFIGKVENKCWVKWEGGLFLLSFR